MLNIQRIYKKNYPSGKKVIFSYTSEKYYKLLFEQTENGWNFSLKEENFETPFVKMQEEEIFQEYKEGSEVYLVCFNGEEAAIMVIQQMNWNNTLLIHDLYVQSHFQNRGIGKSLIDVARKRAVELGVRSIILETQTSNYPAIQFYMKNGFTMVGLNTISYSNEDVNKNEIRLEMAYILKN